MKKIIAAMLVMLMLMPALPVLAEGERSFVVNTDSGAMLIDENGNALTEMGEYDVIDIISSRECPVERRLYMVTQMDLSGGFFMDGDDYSDEEYAADLMDDDWSDGWDEELDDVEEWPVDLESLSDGYEMEVIDDVPVDEETETDQYGGVLDDDFGMDESDYMDYGFSYGVALMNAKGELLTDFDYIAFSHDYVNGVIEAYTFEGFVTMLDEQGNVLTEGMYTSIVSDCTGGFFAVMPDIDPVTGDFSEVAPIVHISADGAIAATGMYTFSYETLPGFSAGYMCVLLCDSNATADSEYQYAFIDVNGTEQFGKRFEYAANFIGGVAEVNDSDYQVHLINTSGEYVTGEGYSYFDFDSTNKSMPIVGNLADGGFDLISASDYSVIASFRPGEEDYYFTAFNSGDGFIFASSEKRQLVLDAAGNILWEGENLMERDVYTGYEHYDSVPERLVVTFAGETGAEAYLTGFDLNAYGSGYREIYPISWIGGEGRYQVIDYDVIEQEYDDVIGLEPDFETIVYGVIDQEGNIVIPMEYDYLISLDHDRYWVGKGTNYKLLDMNGKVIAEFTVE